MKELTLGISNTGDAITYEIQRLIEAGKRHFTSVELINPNMLNFEFRQNKKVKILHTTTDISDIQCLIVRNSGNTQATPILAQSLQANGCIIVDPIDRFFDRTGSKALTTLKRHVRNIGTDSIISFNKQMALAAIKAYAHENLFPLLAKPINGKQGKGVTILEDIASANGYIEQWFEQSQPEPAFIQKWENFIQEYRCIMIGTNCIGVTQRHAALGSASANVATGGQMSMADTPDVISFVAKNCAREGVRGIDIGRKSDGELVIIEENWAPQWKEFERVTGIDVAEEIMKYIQKILA